MQDLLDSLGVQRDAGHRSIERGGSEIEQACRARADDQDAAAELVRADFAVQNLPGGQIALFRLRGEPDPHLAVGFGRHLEVADLHGNDAGLLAKRLLAARARGLHQIGGRALREPEHLGRQSGIERVADAHQHGHAADDLILFGNPVQRARALRLVLQLREARRRARVMRSEQLGIVAAMGEARLGLGQRGGVRRSDEPEHDGALADRLGEDLVVAGKLLDFLAEARRERQTAASSAACSRATCGRARGRPCRSRSPPRRPRQACRRVRQARYAATAIVRSASTTPRRYRRCAPATPDRTRAGRGADRRRRRATAASRPASGPRHATQAQPR